MDVSKKLIDEVMAQVVAGFGPIKTDGDLGMLRQMIDVFTDCALPDRKLEALFNAVLNRTREGNAA